MNIIIDEKSVFTFDRKDLSIHIHTYQTDVYEGQVIHEGKIKFASSKQIGQFAEMIDLLLEDD